MMLLKSLINFQQKEHYQSVQGLQVINGEFMSTLGPADKVMCTDVKTVLKLPEMRMKMIL